jgi:CheY-like chemotaxis protein
MSNDVRHQILLVDDDAGSRDALAKLLRGEGFDVVAVDSGVAAMDSLRRPPLPRLIVLDLMMPAMDGWDFRHEQKRDAELARIPVIAVSAAGKLPGADASFRKPLDFEKFLTAVKRHVQPSRPRGRSERT